MYYFWSGTKPDVNAALWLADAAWQECTLGLIINILALVFLFSAERNHKFNFVAIDGDNSDNYIEI